MLTYFHVTRLIIIKNVEPFGKGTRRSGTVYPVSTLYMGYIYPIFTTDTVLVGIIGCTKCESSRIQISRFMSLMVIQKFCRVVGWCTRRKSPFYPLSIPDLMLVEKLRFAKFEENWTLTSHSISDIIIQHFNAL